jgi:hypothetical protein
MRPPITLRRRSLAAVVAALAIGSLSLAAQSVHEAPAGAPSTGRLVPDGEPGQPLTISDVYQTDHEGYYGVKPASDNRNPRLKLFLRSDGRGTWSFSTIKPGSYPNSRVPRHIHFEVSASGRAPKIFEIVFEGDSFVTPAMRSDPAFSVRSIDGGRVTERIVLR